MRRIGLAVFLALTVAAAAEAKSYTAERYDAVIRILKDGTLHVTETVLFRFESGTFTYVFRQIPTRRTDGIDILEASMDGQPVPFGEGPGKAEVRRKNGIRVTWRFAALEHATHRFDLVYTVRGVVRQTDDGDALVWQGLPSEHSYRIESSTIRFELPAPLAAEPALELRKVANARVTPGESSVTITAENIRSHGWIVATLGFPAGRLITAPPAWQARHQQALALAPRWWAAAALAAFLGLVVLFGVRQSYDTPHRDDSITSTAPALPDDLPPALAGAVAANGQASLETAMATLFSLADRGALTIEEEPRGTFGQRHFTLTRRRGPVPPAEYERTALDIAFGEGKDTVSLSKARTHLVRRLSRFKSAVERALAGAGLLDDDRNRVRRRVFAASFLLLLAGCLGLIPGGMAVRQYEGWPLLVPGAVIMVAIIGFIVGSATTPLSNEGLRRLARWREYQKYLRTLAHDKTASGANSPARLLPFAVALGLATAWSKYLKHHTSAAPPWFHAIAASSSEGAFPAFVATAGANASGGAGGAGGAAGGGASGAG